MIDSDDTNKFIVTVLQIREIKLDVTPNGKRQK